MRTRPILGTSVNPRSMLHTRCDTARFVASDTDADSLGLPVISLHDVYLYRVNLPCTLAILFSLFAIATSAQQRTDPAPQKQATSVEPYYPSKTFAPKVNNRKSKKGFTATHNARDEFYERMEKNWKEREKQEKNIRGESKVNHSLPPYFGHKRPPKKRPPSKMKYCKICGIKH
jgi:hypothetical protein